MLGGVDSSISLLHNNEEMQFLLGNKKGDVVLSKLVWIKKIRNWYEDGTGKSLANVLENHPVNDVRIIENAWNEITHYIGFCMDVCTLYWSDKDGKYITAYLMEDEEEVDLNKWEVHDFQHNILFYPDTVTEDEYYAHCLSMYKEDHRIEFELDLIEEEQNRIAIHGHGYRYLFSKLLDGHTYKTE